MSSLSSLESQASPHVCSDDKRDRERNRDRDRESRTIGGCEGMVDSDSRGSRGSRQRDTDGVRDRTGDRDRQSDTDTASSSVRSHLSRAPAVTAGATSRAASSAVAVAPTASSSSSSYPESQISAHLCGNDELHGNRNEDGHRDRDRDRDRERDRDRNRDRDSERDSERERMPVKGDGSGTVDTNSRGSRDVKQREGDGDGSRHRDNKGGDERQRDGDRGRDRARDRLSDVDKENTSLQSYLSAAGRATSRGTSPPSSPQRYSSLHSCDDDVGERERERKEVICNRGDEEGMIDGDSSGRGSRSSGQRDTDGARDRDRDRDRERDTDRPSDNNTATSSVRSRTSEAQAPSPAPADEQHMGRDEEREKERLQDGDGDSIKERSFGMRDSTSKLTDRDITLSTLPESPPSLQSASASPSSDALSSGLSSFKGYSPDTRVQGATASSPSASPSLSDYSVNSADKSLASRLRQALQSPAADFSLHRLLSQSAQGCSFSPLESTSATPFRYAKRDPLPIDLTGVLSRSRNKIDMLDVWIEKENLMWTANIVPEGSEVPYKRVAESLLGRFKNEEEVELVLGPGLLHGLKQRSADRASRVLKDKLSMREMKAEIDASLQDLALLQRNEALSWDANDVLRSITKFTRRASAAAADQAVQRLSKYEDRVRAVCDDVIAARQWSPFVQSVMQEIEVSTCTCHVRFI